MYKKLIKQILPSKPVKLVALFIAFFIALQTVSLNGANQIVNAQPDVVDTDIKDRESIPLDTKLSDQSANSYGLYEEICLVRLSAARGVSYSDSSDWMKGFYYYSITKLGFIDIPFNYIVTWDGLVYTGRGGGEGIMLPIDTENSDLSSNCMVIAYFDNNREFTNAGKDSLEELISKNMGKYGIEKAEVFSVESFLKKHEDNTPSQLVLKKDEESSWQDIVANLLRNASPATIDINYQAEIESVESVQEVDAGQNFEVKVKAKNTGDFPWYPTGDKKIIVATSDPRDHESDFFVSDKWISFSKVVTMNQDWVLSDEEAEFTFEMSTPLIPGEYTEKFELLVMPGNWVENSQFEVSFKVNSAGLDLVEILDTETGSLNVRDCPSTGCDQIGKVVPGDILVKVGSDGNWYEVEFGDGETGWVYGKYVNDI
jgi:hypothetical protein